MEKDRVTVITGATGGLGREVTRQFNQAGDRLALYSSSEENLRQLVGDLDLPADRHITAALDFRDPHAAQTALQKAVERFGRVDILLHFVGGWAGGNPISAVQATEMENMLDQHVWTTFFLLKAFLPHLKQNGWGRIVVVSSPAAGAPGADGGPYAAAKAAQETLILTAAQEGKGSGVTANVIRVKAIDVEHKRIQAPSKTNAAWTTPEEIAAAVRYLCSAEAGMVNGARIPLFGNS